MAAIWQRHLSEKEQLIHEYIVAKHENVFRGFRFIMPLQWSWGRNIIITATILISSSRD